MSTEETTNEVTNEATDEKNKKVEEQNPSQAVADALAVYSGAPDKSQIEKWKQEFGEVFCSGLSDTELFIWRPIKRTEYQKLQLAMNQQQDPQKPVDYEAEVSKICVLWASPAAYQSLDKKAGSLTALNEQIMAHSNFIDPRIAVSLVIRL